MRVRFAATVFLVLGPVVTVQAHHGRDFLLARTAELPHPGQIFVAPRQDVVHQPESTPIELEPSVMVGVGERFALEIHSHIAREHSSGLSYESTAPAVHARLTPDDAPWGAGVSVEYEMRHGEDSGNRLETRWAVSRQTGSSRVAVNIVAGHGGVNEDTGVDRSGVDWGYAAGVRHRLAKRMDWGFEGQGELSHEGGHEVLAGLYSDLSDRLTVNLGVGAGLGPNAPGFTLRTAVVMRLR